MIISKFQRNRENVIFRQNSHKREPNSPNPWRRKDRNNLKDESINWVNTRRATKLQPPLGTTTWRRYCNERNLFNSLMRYKMSYRPVSSCEWIPCRKPRSLNDVLSIENFPFAKFLVHILLLFHWVY